MGADRARWDLHWTRNATDLDQWDYLSEVIFRVLRDEIKELAGRYIVEAGSGSGRISLRLASQGAWITLVDYGLVALELGRSQFNKQGIPSNLVLADIHDLPFKDASFNIVWNAGVMEHYLQDRRTESLESLFRLCRPGGLLITLNPYAGSLTYRFGKSLLERLKRWPYGEEYPVRTLRGVSGGSQVQVTKEYSIGFFVTLVEAYKFLPSPLSVNRFFKRVSRFCIKIAGVIAPVDRFFSKIFGGYLLVSVIERSK